MISPLAYVHPEAIIGENVEIGPFVFIDKNVVIGDNNTIMPNANILYGSRIGNNNRIFPGDRSYSARPEIPGRRDHSRNRRQQHHTRECDYQPGHRSQRENHRRKQQPPHGRRTCGTRHPCRKRMHHRKLHENGR